MTAYPIPQLSLSPSLTDEKNYDLVVIGGSGGRRWRTPPPNSIHFFRFHIRFCQKVYASEVGVPQRVGAPPTGNPGSAIGCFIGLKTHLVILVIKQVCRQ